MSQAAVSSPDALATNPAIWLRVALLALFVLSILRIAWLCDDAFMTFRTVDNFVHGYGLTWNTDERVQAYTHPLWMFLMAAAYFVTREVIVTPIAVSVLVSAAAVAVVLFRLTTTAPRALLFVALLLLSKALLDFSTSGLENPLSFLLVAWFVAVWQAQAATPMQRLSRLFFIGGLAALNRQDLVLLLGPALALTLWQLRSWPALRASAYALLPVFAWELFSLCYYGFPFPNTYYAKLTTGIAAADYALQGLIYLQDTLTQDPATMLIVGLSLAAALVDGRRSRQWPLAVGIALYVAYVVSVGGDFMQGRFLSVPAFLGLILLVQHPAEISTSTQRLPALALLALAGVLANGLIATRYDEGLSHDELKFRANGVADERQFYMIFGQGLSRLRRGGGLPESHPWALLSRMRREDPVNHVFPVQVAGIPGFTAGPKVHLVDAFALSDPLLARLPISGAWRIGHFQRALPDGYLQSLRSNRNQISDPGIAELYDALKLVTQGPIWSWRRFRMIAFLNTGGAGRLLAKAFPPVPVAAEKLLRAKPGHYAWNGPDTVVIGRHGVDVRFDGEHHEPRLSISVDNNDQYRLRFCKGADADDCNAELRLPPGNTGDGLLVRDLPVPAAAVERGYDHVQVLPDGGDGYYSIGHLILENLPPAAN